MDIRNTSLHRASLFWSSQFFYYLKLTSVTWDCWLKVSALCIAKFCLSSLLLLHENGVHSVLNFISRIICVVSFVIALTEPLNLTQQFQAKKRQIETL